MTVTKNDNELIETLAEQYKYILSQIPTLSPKKTIEHIVSYYEDIISCMPGNVFWFNKNCIAVGCNQNVLDMFNFKSLRQFKGLTFEEMGRAGNWTKEATESFKNDTLNVLKSGLPKLNVEEPPIPHPSGRMLYFLSSRVPIFNEDHEVIGAVGISVDISELKHTQIALKKAKEEAEASNRAKGQFLAVINHELRTPLTGIIGLVNLLKKGNLSQHEETHAIEDLESCAQHLLSLVNDVLDFTRLEAERIAIHIGPVSLENIIDEVFSILTGIAKNKGLLLRYHIDKNVPSLIFTDGRGIRQILLNFIGNAIKFTEKGSVEVIVDTLHKTNDKIKLRISVKDTGYGIPPEKLGVVFEPFQQLEDPYLRQSSRSGTGLGLAIVRRLCKLMGLEVDVVSDIGKGSTFSIVGEFGISEVSQFNVSTHPQEVLTPEFEKIKSIRALASKIQVLLVEDDKIVQHIHKSMLEDLGCDVTVATFGREALQLFDHHQIVFVDIGLSDITGFEVIKEIHDKVTSPIPIIALTGYTGEDERVRCLAAGANEIAIKPISLEGLKDILLRYVAS